MRLFHVLIDWVDNVALFAHWFDINIINKRQHAGANEGII